MFTDILVILFSILSILLLIGVYCFFNREERQADWRGKLEKRFRWSKTRREFGCYCYKTQWPGGIDASWWEWETP